MTVSGKVQEGVDYEGIFKLPPAKTFTSTTVRHKCFFFSISIVLFRLWQYFFFYFLSKKIFIYMYIDFYIWPKKKNPDIHNEYESTAAN